MGDAIKANRTKRFGYLALQRNLFGDYLEVFARHLNAFYAEVPANVVGWFLDIGGAGSVVSGMQQVQSKFLHFAGPLEYWLQDVDEKARGLNRTVVCDICNCTELTDCSFDVTFSHTVLEHVRRPWAAFDTIARITKRGGLTLHLVPWSYQYHATPADHFRFSHQGLASLLEDRGFKVLEVGYDICKKPENVRIKEVTEHYDTIWLTY